MSKRIVFATANKGKLREIKEVFAASDYEIVSMAELGIDVDIVEDGTTFAENAYKKARVIWEVCKGIVMADDSGLVIDYLNGEPGVYSARYLSEYPDYKDKNEKILELLREAEGEERSARFVAYICCILEDAAVIETHAFMEGFISKEQRGAFGFGYDPIFYLPEFGKTSAELGLEEKNKISHRGKALELMLEKLNERGK